MYILSTAPSAPVITTVTANDSHSVHIAWRAPVEPNGVIAGYNITYNSSETNLTVFVPYNGGRVSNDK